MNPERVEEIRERWTDPLTEAYATAVEEADYRDVRDLLAEIDELWRASRASGGRIVALTHQADRLQAELNRAQSELNLYKSIARDLT